MQFFILVLLFCFFVFLFSLHRLSKDDFLLIRKAVSMDIIFNAAFSTAFVSLVVSRILYIFSYPRPVFFTFLGSFLFPYFPGLSLIGCVYGGAIFLILYSLSKKIPVNKLLDFFSLSFLFALPFGLLFVYLATGTTLPMMVSLVFYIVYLLINIFILVPLTVKGRLKDGGIAFLFLSVFTLFTILINTLFNGFNITFNAENIVLFPGIIIFLSLFIYNQFIKSKGY